MKLGVLGGTFDPVHHGHLAIAQEAMASLGLDQVVFIPAGVPWMKQGQSISLARHRLAMARLAVANHPGFRTSATELRRPGPTYTVDTLRELRKGPGAGDQIHLLVGSDAFLGMHEWREPLEISKLCTLVVFSRTGSNFLESSPARAEFCSFCDGPHHWFWREASRRIDANLVHLEGPMIDISGSEIRRRVVKGLPIRYQVPEAVEAYIAANNLYQLDEESVY